MRSLDSRCVVTNLPLRGRRAVFVAVIEVEPGTWQPISLPIAGDASGTGSLTDITTDFRSAVLAQGVEEAARTGRVEAKAEVSAELARARPLSPAGALGVIARATSVAKATHTDALRIDGRAVRHVLILEDVYEAIVGDAGALPKTDPYAAVVQVRVRDCFEDPFGEWLHRDLHKTLGPTRRKVLGALQEVIAVRAWFDAAKLTWTGSGLTPCDHADDFVANLAARVRFADAPGLLRVLQSHARRLEAETASTQSEALPERWLRDAAVSWYGLRTGAGAFAATKAEALLERLAQQLQTPEAVSQLAELVVVQAGVTALRVDLLPMVAKAMPPGTSVEAAQQALRVGWKDVTKQLPKLAAPKAKAPVLVWPEPLAPESEGFTLRRFELAQ